MDAWRTGGARRWRFGAAASWCGVLALLAAAGCARQSAPPGGPPDARPPVVVRTVPEGLARVPDFEGPVRFEFDERISEQAGGGTLDAAVTVSPRTGEVRVSHGRRSLEVEIGGGFRPGVVYRVTLQPVVRDMFGNTLRDPFELVFSTGAEPEETAVAGEVWDRVTGRGLTDVTLHAVGQDSLVHVASSGEGGIYAFRYVPSGAYDLTAFQDQDADGLPDATETQGASEFQLAAGDTVFVDVSVLAPDTTEAVLLGAEIMDSVTIALRFDDYVDPSSDLNGTQLEVVAEGGGAVGIERTFHAADWIRHVAEARDSLARADSVARADSLAALPEPGAVAPPADTIGAPAPPDSLAAPAPGDAAVPAGPTTPPRRGPPPLPGGGIQGLEPARERGRVLPGRRIVLVLDRALDPEATYSVRASGIVNLNALGGGGGTVEAEPLAVTGAGGSR